MNVVDRLRALLDPRPTATARGMTADRVTRWTWRYRPAATWPADDRLTPDRAARILWSPAALTITDDQFEAIGRVLGLTPTAVHALTATDQATATARPAVYELTDDQLDQVGRVLGLTATDQATATADRSGDQVTATGRPSATDRATVSVAAGPTATATGPDRSADRVTGPQRGRGAA